MVEMGMGMLYMVWISGAWDRRVSFFIHDLSDF
jgi:hypothetical protein